jgi:hypothetical protein
VKRAERRFLTVSVIDVSVGLSKPKLVSFRDTNLRVGHSPSSPESSWRPHGDSNPGSQVRLAISLFTVAKRKDSPAGRRGAFI